MLNDVQAKRRMLFSGLRMVHERSVNPMKRFKVICIGYKEPSKEKIKDLLEFEENYLGNKRKVCIHPGVCIAETENYNKSVLDELETQGYEEYNLDGSDLDTKYDFNARHDFVITI